MSLYHQQIARELGFDSTINNIVLNQHFAEFLPSLERAYRFDANAGRYDLNETDKQLLARARLHTSKHQIGNLQRRVILFVHPFYLLNNIPNIVGTSKEQELQQYVAALLPILKRDNFPKNTSLVLFESPHDYACITSLFAERGAVDYVIFTEHRRGYVLDNKDLQLFQDRDVYVGGCYNTECVMTAMIDIVRSFVGSSSTLTFLQGLVLTPPSKGPSLFPKYVVDAFGRAIPAAECVSIDELVEEGKK